MFGYIYITTNMLNGKKYIGKHQFPEFDKFYKGSGTALKKAFKKYGLHNFKCEILQSVNNVPTICESFDELNSSEIYYINFYDAVNSSDYYNMSWGGEGVSSIDCTGSNNSMFGVHRVGEDAPTYGRLWYNNGVSNVMIPPDKVQEYELKGYTPGQLPRKFSEKRAKVRKDVMLGRVGYTNGLVNVLIFPEEIDKYVKQGYVRGRTSKHQINKNMEKI